MVENRKIRAALVGFGNVGRFALEAVQAACDFELAGVVLRPSSQKRDLSPELKEIPVFFDLEELEGVDVALLCVPTRQASALAGGFLRRGINTVDSFDLHGGELLEHRRLLQEEALRGKAAAVVAAGWDPGTDSLVRALMEMLAPRGITFTNFGPGMSLGHSVAAKEIEGVADALAITIPKGSGLHRRLIYLKLKEGAALAEVAERLGEDPYFKQDELQIYPVQSFADKEDAGHGVVVERKGTAGFTSNQLLRWEMRIHNPALTAQVMVGAARAACRQAPGAYTLLEIPLADYFSENKDQLIERLV